MKHPSRRLLVALAVIVLALSTPLIARSAELASTFLPMIRYDYVEFHYMPLAMVLPTFTPTPAFTATPTITPTPLGPPPTWIDINGGSYVDILFEPFDPNVVYASAWNNGIAKSLDGGKSWLLYGPGHGLPILQINVLAADPQTPGLLYAGTAGYGIYRSRDAGANWEPANNGIEANSKVYSIAIDPVNPSRIYASARLPLNCPPDDPLCPPFFGKVYRSEDAGQSWKVVLANVPDAGTQDWGYDIVINPNPGYNNNVAVAMHESGPYLSRDFGDTWTPISNGIFDLSGRAMAIDPRTIDPMRMYFATWHRYGVFRTENSGASWWYQPWPNLHTYALSMDPTNPDILYIATFDSTSTDVGFGVIKTLDGGYNWFNSGMIGINIYSVAISPANHLRVLAGSAGNGMFVSNDGGLTWVRPALSFSAGAATGLVGFSGAPGALAVGAENGGVKLSKDGGQTWNSLTTTPSPDVSALVADPNDPARFFALTTGGDLLHLGLDGSLARVESLPVLSGMAPGSAYLPSADAAHPFASHEAVMGQAENNQPEALSAAGKAPLLALAFAPSDARVAYLGSSGAGVLRSQDGGQSWSPAGLAGQVVWSLAVDPQDSQKVFAAGRAPGLVWLTTDGGDSWREIRLPQASPVYALGLTGRTLFAGTGSGVWQWDGKAWSQAGLAGETVTVIAESPAGGLYAGTAHHGAFISTDGGKTWMPGPQALDGQTIRAIIFDPNDPRVAYYSTQGRGVLRDRR